MAHTYAAYFAPGGVVAEMGRRLRRRVEPGRKGKDTIVAMDNRVKTVIEREEERRRVNVELRERYRRVLRRTVLSFDSPGRERVVYENEKMIDRVQEELDGRVRYMEQVAKALQDRVEHTEERMARSETDKVQQRVELLNQKIRILEATVRHIVSRNA